MKKEPLFNKINPNLAGKPDTDKKAVNKVLSVYDKYKKMRNFTQGGKEIYITDEWDERYRLYKCIRDTSDHNYTTGIAQVFAPIARKEINVIDSEISNALFSREDYFRFNAVSDKPENMEDAHKAQQILLHYSNNRIANYPAQFDIAAKQCAIYGFTCAEVVWYKEEFDNIKKIIEEIPITDEKTGEPIVIDIAGKQIPQIKKIIKLQKEHTIVEHPLILARDIYRLYINHLNNNPIDDDIVYRDSMSAQKLLEMAELEVYNKKAVQKLLNQSPKYNNTSDVDDEGTTGKSFYDDISFNSDKINNKYEVLRFQGLFSVKDADGKTIKHEQYWIDIGERNIVLRIIKNPLWNNSKTFAACSYDTLYNESYVDGVIDNGTKSIQYEINDKENQSLDAISFTINAPFLKSRRSKIRNSEIAIARKSPNYVIETNDMQGLMKVQEQINVAHLSNEIMRLIQYADTVTGATNVLAGIPTGTQADRSGKSLGIIQMGAKSQFSKFIRKYEQNFMEILLNTAWNMVIQFSSDTIPIQYFSDTINNTKLTNQSVQEIVSELKISVSAGSEYIKNKELIEAMLNFISIINVREEWAMSVDAISMLKEIARSMPFDMSAYVNPDNAMSKLVNQNKQLVQMLKQYEGSLTQVNQEAVRLKKELLQTNRSNMANPSPLMKKNNISAVNKTQGG